MREKIRFFRPPNKEDLQALQEAEKRLKENWDWWGAEGLIPIENFPQGNRNLNKRFQTETLFIYRTEIDRLLSSMGRKEDATIMAFNSLGVVIWFLRWYSSDGRASLDEVIESIIKFVLRGIIGRNGSDDSSED